MTLRRVWRKAALITLAVAVGAGAALDVRGSSSPSVQGGRPHLTTATAVRTDLTTTVLTPATVGYPATAPVIDAASGVYTALPPVGAVIRPGAAVFSVNATPVILLAGETPAYRAFELGMTAGPDVAELGRDLISGGYAQGLLTQPTTSYTYSMSLAVSNWQLAHDQPVTGTIPLGQVTFHAGAVRVASLTAELGQAAVPGASPLLVTGTTKIVTVPVTADLPPVAPGDRLQIVLADGHRIAGTVTTVAFTAPQTLPSAAGTSPAPAPTQLEVLPTTPLALDMPGGTAVQVSITIQSVRAVIAVPITALLALAGGGYGVQIIDGAGHDRLVEVTTGLFADTLVQVTSPRVTSGTRVVVTA